MRSGSSINVLGLAGLLPLVGRLGWKGILLVVVVFVLFRMSGMSSMCAGGGSGDPAPADPRGRGALNPGAENRAESSADELVNFVGYVLDDAQTSMGEHFQRDGRTYRPARLVVFTDVAASGCGTASSAVGPFYCPLDQRVYVDLSFYRELHRRFGAPGDFAQAYVIAHEIGHHVQHQFDALDKGGGGESSIETELQADCLAGVWARDAERRGLLEEGDMGEALDAAAAVGDDNIQRQTSGRVQPETWTHGSSAQRKRAFQRGFDGASLAACGL